MEIRLRAVLCAAALASLAAACGSGAAEPPTRERPGAARDVDSPLSVADGFHADAHEVAAPPPDVASDDVPDAAEPADAAGDLLPDLSPDAGGCASDEACVAALGTLPPCRVARCDPVTGGCVEAAADDGTSCDDADACTGPDLCAAGVCGGAALVCDDGDPCNGAEACTPEVGCEPGAAPECDDGDPCNGLERCESHAGCVAGPALACDDGTPCTADTCVPFVGCRSEPTSGPCDDGDACTVGDRCGEGVCVPGLQLCLCPADDRHEDNDDAGAATPIHVDRSYPTATVLQGVVCGTDVDWFSVDLVEGDALHVELEHAPSSGALSLRIRDASGVVLGELPPGLSPAVLEMTASSDGPVFLRIAGDGSAAAESPWLLDLFHVPARSCADDDFEDDDVPSLATPLAIDASMLARACPFDMDWFVFATSGGGTVVVDLEPTDAARYPELDLYDAQARRVATGVVAGGVVRALHPVSGPTVVFARVTTSGLGGVDYAIRGSEVAPGVCVEDAWEPNDAQAAAALLPPAGTALARLCPASPDWYGVPLAAGDRLVVDLAHDLDAGSADVAITGPRGDAAEGPVLAATASTGGVARLEVVAATDGMHGVRVSGALVGGTPYDLTLSGTGAWVCTPDPCEDDDRSESACVLIPGHSLEARRCAGDDDWFAFQVDAPLLPVRAVLTRDGGADELLLTLRAPDGTVVTTASMSGGAATLSATAATPGRWTLQVTGEGDADEAAYTLWLAPPDGVCLDDDLEPNDDAGAAAPLALGEAHDLFLCPGDEDWFTVTVGPLAVVDVFVVAGLGTAAPPALALDDVGGALLATGTPDPGGVGVVRLNHPVLAPGTYRVRVAAGGPVDYSLVVNEERWLCTEDGYEPNDGVAEAAPLVAPASVQAVVCGGDPDWYRIELDEGDRVDVDLRFRHAVGDLNLYLTRSNGQSLALGASRDDDEHVSWTATEAGSYGIRVFGLLGASAPYALDIAVERAVQPCEDDDFEDDDTIATATPVVSGLLYDLQACPGDDDWFAVAAAAGDTLVVTVSHESAIGDLNVTVYRPDGVVVVEAQRVIDAERAIVTAQQAGVYRMRVHGATSDVEVAYAFSALVLPSGPDGCADDAFEPNDTPDEAATVATSTGAADVTAQLCAGDPDWYAVSLPGGKTLAVTVTHGTAGALELTVEAPSGAPIGASEATAEAPAVVVADALAAGAYRIRVDGAEGVTTGYRLEVSVGEWVCVEDAFEENDDVLSAVNVTGLSSLDGVVCGGDADWYAVDLVEGDTVSLDLRFVHAAGDLNLYLTRPNGQTLVFGGTVTDDEHVEYTVPAEGRYGVRVFGLRGASNRYHLDLAVTPAAP